MSVHEVLGHIAEKAKTAETISDVEWVDVRVAQLAAFALKRSEILLDEVSRWPEVAST